MAFRASCTATCTMARVRVDTTLFWPFAVMVFTVVSFHSRTSLARAGRAKVRAHRQTIRITVGPTLRMDLMPCIMARSSLAMPRRACWSARARSGERSDLRASPPRGSPVASGRLPGCRKLRVWFYTSPQCATSARRSPVRCSHEIRGLGLRRRHLWGGPGREPAAFRPKDQEYCPPGCHTESLAHEAALTYPVGDARVTLSRPENTFRLASLVFFPAVAVWAWRASRLGR